MNPDDFEEEPLDEFGYEKLMRESDARTDKAMKLYEKYRDHPDCEKLVAHEMGWEWLEDTLEAKERDELLPPEPIEIPPLEPDPLTEGVDWIRDDHGGIRHPLSKRAFEIAMGMWHFLKDRNLLEEGGDDDLREMIFEFQTTGAKLAGALNSLGYVGDLREGAFVVAALKRALAYLHKSIATSEKVMEKRLVDSERLKRFRGELFGVREEILRLMKRFREGSQS